MKSAFAIAITTASLATAPAWAQDQDTGGVYVSGAAGVSLSDDQLINGFNAAGSPRRIVTDMDRGITVRAALGYATADKPWGRVRAEAELYCQKAKLIFPRLRGH